MTARLIRFGIGLLAVVATTACGDPLATTATVATIEDTLAVYGLTEAPPSGPTALNTFLRQVVRTDPSQNFDIVFDISVDENTGDTVAYLFPAGAVSKFGTSGIIKDTINTYDALLQAPVSGYNDSTAFAIKPGDVFIIQARSYACLGQLVTQRQYVYSKIVIDSVHTAPYDPLTRPDGSTIYFRMRVDPNCGFLSFADGVPKV